MKKIWLLSLLAAWPAVFSCATDHAEPRGVVREGGTFITNLSPVERNGALELTIEASGKMQYTVFKLDNPRRVVIDAPSADASAFLAPISLSKGVATKVAAHYSPKTGDSRIEIFVKDAVECTVNRLTDNKVVAIIGPSSAASAESAAGVIGGTEILGIDVKEESGMTRITIPFKGDKPKFELIKRRELNRITLEISDARIKKADEKTITVETETSPVKDAAVFQFSAVPPKVKVAANLSEYTSSNAFVKDDNLVLDIGPEAVLATASVFKEVKKGAKPAEISKKEKLPGDYEGRKVTLDFQGADVHNILRILAEVGDINIITSEKVQGKVTMKLSNVPWDMALEIILKNNQLAMIRTGNIIRVATSDEIAKERENQASTQSTVEKVEPLYLKVFPVNYESSKLLKANLESVKTPRGAIDVNERTNTLIIRDTKEKLAEMEKLISVLDKRTVQVLIEARIVEVTRTSAQQLGIKWGGSVAPSTGSLGLPGTLGLSGLTTGTTSVATSAAGGVVNLGPSGSPTGQLGLRFGSIDGVAALDMQLMALENDGLGRVISMPKISTMNNTEAIIESGEEIPYQTVSASGTQTQFKNASLILKVTPHATENNLIRLDIEANKDEPDFANQLPNSPPPILTKHAKTVVLIKDGDTTVIGGLFTETTNENRARVPFFASIPIIGYLFKNLSTSSDNGELLIFITPKVL